MIMTFKPHFVKVNGSCRGYASKQDKLDRKGEGFVDDGGDLLKVYESVSQSINKYPNDYKGYALS